MKAAFLAAAVLAAASVVFYFGNAEHAANASGPGSVERRSAERTSAAARSLSSNALALPLFFEPNQGQTAAPVKFLARGAGYGLFLTADEAVLELQPPAVRHQPSLAGSQPASRSVIQMRLEGANPSARVSGASPLPGKSSYFIGNDPSRWHRDIPQFARVQYQAVYPGVDLVYYGDQGQLEYDFRVAPGADANQIALSFKGASAHIATAESGDLVLSTPNGDIRFHAPHVYQSASPGSGRAPANAEQTIPSGFRQLADNKIGFAIGAYDHSRELVIDPVLNYSTYLGGSKDESFVSVAIGPDSNIYLAGSTMSQDFPLSVTGTPFQATNAGAQNVFIAVINPGLQPSALQLVYATYLGGSGSDSAAGIAVSSNTDQSGTGYDVYVAGTTTSSNFPTNGALAGFEATAPTAGTHGFVTRLNLGTNTLRYSTYLAGTNAAGNASDTVTGLAIDTHGDAFVTGTTTSTDGASSGFPASANGYQQASYAPFQFFASKIDTKESGTTSMLYSTYFGGGNPQTGQTKGGGVAVDTGGNMYITGGTNFLPVAGPNPGQAAFPLLNAQQSCLDEVGKITCTTGFNTNPLDAFVAKINPNAFTTASLIYSTYVGGSGDDIGYGIAVDNSSNAYITGSTYSTDFIPSALALKAFQPCLNNAVYNPANTPPCPPSSAKDAFIAEIVNETTGGAVFPINYATYIGGSADDSGQAIVADSVQGAHVTGWTGSVDLPVTPNTYQANNGGGVDAFVGLILITESGQGAGDYLTYLGGEGSDYGTGIALDALNATYVAGTTQSAHFPTMNPYQAQLNGGSQDAFVSKIGAKSGLTLTQPTTSPSPNPAPAGGLVTFTFNITNIGPDTATLVNFDAILPATGITATHSATVISGSGACTVQGLTVGCNIATLAVNAVAEVQIVVTPSIPVLNQQLTIVGTATANNSGVVAGPLAETANVVDFNIAASTPAPINAGDPPAVITITFCPTPTSDQYGGYIGIITPSQTTLPAMVTATTPTFNPTTVTLAGSACATTALSIATLARPVNTGSLLRRGSLYAAWLPIGGLSLVGLGVGASRKRRRWLAAAVLCLIAGAMLVQAGCGSSSSSTTSTGGTQAGNYAITITGSSGTGGSHNTQVVLVVH